MGNNLHINRDINQWHEGFQLLRQEWLKWLDLNCGKYSSSQEAWTEFKAYQEQQQCWLSHEATVAKSLPFK